jgi:hypothetical protein
MRRIPETAVSAPDAPDAPAAPSLTELLDFAQRSAGDPGVLARLPLDSRRRTWISLPGPGGAEAWAIGWPPGSETGWHDHGGSRGALATASGRLREDSIAVALPAEGWRLLELADGVDRGRELPAGRGRAFGSHHVHQVLNPSGFEHAVSVHVYHPPLPLIRRYRRHGLVLGLADVEQPQEW